MRQLFFLCISIILLTGCELYKQDEYQEYYVVESYLVANKALPSILLSKTIPLEEEYTFKDAVVGNAEVEVRLLNSDSTVERHYDYTFGEEGSYRPVNRGLVQGERLYQLYITLPNDDIIEATTFVPGNFETVNKDELQDSFEYQNERQVMIKTTPSAYITNRQTYYIFTVNAAEPDSINLTPFYKNLVIDENNSIQNFTINSSGIINEKNYDRNPDNTITLKVPWVAVAFYGDNDIITNAIDDNMYDFLRTQSVQTGGISISPGEIQNINYNIQGGIGIFGSLASDTNRVVITRPAN